MDDYNSVFGAKMSSKQIPAEPVKEKLRNLRQLMPAEYRQLHKFGAYLADKLGDEVNPEGFAALAVLAPYGLKDGIDWGSGQKLRIRWLTLQDPVVYRYLRSRIPQMARAVFDEDAAKQAIEFYERTA